MRNRIKLFIVSVFSIALVTFACTSSETPENDTLNANISTNTSENKQTYRAVGVIKNIDAENNEITIAHEDIPGYMSAMEMTEAVSDKSILTDLKTGDKVDFEIERTGSKIVIIKLKKIGEVQLVNGAEIYKTNCAECHGANGEGAKKGIPLISGHALHHSEAEHIEQVTNGKNGKKGKMPAFKDKLSTEEIKQVVAFVRSDLQKNVVREPSHQHKH